MALFLVIVKPDVGGSASHRPVTRALLAPPSSASSCRAAMLDLREILRTPEPKHAGWRSEVGQ